MAKGKNRLKAIADKNARKAVRMKTPGESSNYAKKAKYLAKHNVFGFDVPEPKPWKSGK
jgi:hypothetical protein